MNAISSIILLGLGTILSGGLNYLYHPIMMQFMSRELFAEFESLIGIFNVLGVITSSFTFFLVKELVTKKEGQNGGGLAKFLLTTATYWLIGVGFVCYIFYILGSPLIMSIIETTDSGAVWLVGGMIVLSFFNITGLAVLQAKEKFIFLSANTVIASLLRILFGGGVIYLGVTLMNALGGFLLATFLSFGLTYFYALKSTYSESSATKEEKETFKKDLINELPNLGHFFHTSVLLALLMNIDVIFATTFLGKETAGWYAGIAVVAKFILFVIGAIDTVYYPKTIKNKIINTSALLNAGKLMIVGISVSALIGYFIGDFALGLISKDFIGHGHLFSALIGLFGLYSLIAYGSRVLTAIGIYIQNWLISCILVITCGYFYIFHGNIETYLAVLSGTIILSGLSVFIPLLLSTKQQKLR